jgi:DNA-binding transcriptional ArsR family regulator
VLDPIAVLAAPRRREILRLVWRRGLGAGEIHRALPDATFGAISQQLAALERAGLVTSRRDGRRRFYRARPDALGPVRAALEAMWDDALYRLRLHAELEAGRRGPRPRSRRTRPRRRP